MSRTLLTPTLRALALLAVLATLVALALAPAHPAQTSWRADPGGPSCCGGEKPQLA